MRNQILEDLKSAMKAQDKLKLSVIRMVKSSIQMEELNVKHELTDDEVISIIAKQIKITFIYLSFFLKFYFKIRVHYTSVIYKIQWLHLTVIYIIF